MIRYEVWRSCLSYSSERFTIGSRITLHRPATMFHRHWWIPVRNVRQRAAWSTMLVICYLSFLCQRKRTIYLFLSL